MARTDRKRLDVSLKDDLFLKVKMSATVDGRSINGQIAWLLTYALIDWYERRDNDPRRLQERSAV